MAWWSRKPIRLSDTVPLAILVYRLVENRNITLPYLVRT
jgi:hypothetical protein